MIDVETARVTVVGGVTLAWVLGGGLAVTVGFAATVPIHTPVRVGLTRACAWTLKALRMALRAFVWVLCLPSALAVTYFHVGWRRQRHAYVTRGRHRPAYVKRHPWTAPKGWSTPLYGWSATA